MGHVHGSLILKNPRRPELPPVEVVALADSGAVHLCIPSHICERLELETSETRPATLADGSTIFVPYAGPIELRFKNRVGYTGALVMGDQVLLGAVPMEDMDLIIICRTQRVDVNPESPHVGRLLAKGFGG